MTDKVSSTSSTTLLASAEETDSDGALHNSVPANIWPLVTSVLVALAALMAVVLTLLQYGVEPNLVAFHTGNVFWILTTVGTATTLTLAASAAGFHPHAWGAGRLRRFAAALIVVHLMVLTVIAVVQVTFDARAEVMAETGITSIAVIFAAIATLLGVIAGRRAKNPGRENPSHTSLAVGGLVCVLVGQTTTSIAAATRFQQVNLDVSALWIGTLVALSTLIGVWLVGRQHKTAVWAGAVMLCLVGALSVGSLSTVGQYDFSWLYRLVQVLQYLLFAAGAVTALFAGRTASLLANRP